MSCKSCFLRINCPNLLIDATNTRCLSHGDFHVARIAPGSAPRVPDNIVRNRVVCGVAYCCRDVGQVGAALIRGDNPAFVCQEDELGVVKGDRDWLLVDGRHDRGRG